MASIQAMLSVSSNAHAAPSAPAEPHDNDFHAVLASYAPAAQPARDVPRDTRAVKPVKAIERAASPVKVSRKENRAADTGAPKKAERDSKQSLDADQAQIIPSQHAQPLPVRTGMAAQQHGDDRNHQNASDEAVQATPVITDISKAAIAPSSATTPLIKATLPQELIASAAKPSADPVSTDHQKPVADLVRTDQQKPATTPLPRAVTDEITAAAKAPLVQQLKAAANDPIAAAKPEHAQPEQQPASSAAPQRPQSLVANIITMLNAARGTIAVTTQPKQVVAASSEVKSEVSSANAPRVAVSTAPPAQADQQPPTTGKSAQNVRVDANDVAPKPVVVAGIDTKSDAASTQSPRLVDSKAQQPRAEQQTATADTTAQNTRADANDVVPRPGVVPNSNTTSDARSATALPPADSTAHQPRAEQQAATADTTAQNTRGDARDVSQDRDSQPTDRTLKADTAPEPVSQALPQPATQVTAPANQVVAAVMPNAVNTTAAASTAAAQRPVSADAHDTDQPNLSALATAIAVKSAAGTKTFDIRMDPPELGRVDVHLSVDRDGKVQAMLSAEHPRTLELLQRDSQHLERALKDAGLDLSNNSLNFSLKGEGRQGDGGGAFTARARSMPNAVVARAEAANASVSNFNYASGDGRLDIRV